MGSSPTSRASRGTPSPRLRRRGSGVIGSTGGSNPPGQGSKPCSRASEDDRAAVVQRTRAPGYEPGNGGLIPPGGTREGEPGDGPGTGSKPDRGARPGVRLLRLPPPPTLAALAPEAGKPALRSRPSGDFLRWHLLQGTPSLTKPLTRLLSLHRERASSSAELQQGIKRHSRLDAQPSPEFNGSAKGLGGGSPKPASLVRLQPLPPRAPVVKRKGTGPQLPRRGFDSHPVLHLENKRVSVPERRRERSVKPMRKPRRFESSPTHHRLLSPIENGAGWRSR